MAHSNQPISEQYRIAGVEWVELDRVASLLEQTKSAVLSQITAKHIEGDLKLSLNKAEMAARTSADWHEFISSMVEARSKANLAKINLEYMRMRHMEQMSHEATSRAESRL